MPVIVNGSTGITTGTDTVTTITSPTATALTIQSGGTTAMTINTGLSVGIGTTTPSEKLDVAGAIRSSGSTNPYFVLSDGTNNGYMQLAGNVFNFYTAQSIPMTFSTAGSEKMRIDSNGNVGIGTSSPIAKLNVKTLDATTTAMIAGTTIGARYTTDASGIYIDGTDPTGISSYQPLFVGGSTWGVRISGSIQMSVNASGNLLFNSGYGSAAVAYGCRAWVNLNGAGGAAAIRGSGGVSSVAYISTGRYTINFTNTMPDTNYAVVFGGFNTVNNDGGWNVVNATSGAYPTGQNTTSVNIGTYTSAGSFADQSAIYVAIFR